MGLWNHLSQPRYRHLVKSNIKHFDTAKKYINLLNPRTTKNILFLRKLAIKVSNHDVFRPEVSIAAMERLQEGSLMRGQESINEFVTYLLDTPSTTLGGGHWEKAIKMIDPDHKERDGDPNCERKGMKTLLRLANTAIGDRLQVVLEHIIESSVETNAQPAICELIPNIDHRNEKAMKTALDALDTNSGEALLALQKAILKGPSGDDNKIAELILAKCKSIKSKGNRTGMINFIAEYAKHEQTKLKAGVERSDPNNKQEREWLKQEVQNKDLTTAKTAFDKLYAIEDKELEVEAICKALKTTTHQSIIMENLESIADWSQDINSTLSLHNDKVKQTFIKLAKGIDLSCNDYNGNISESALQSLISNEVITVGELEDIFANGEIPGAQEQAFDALPKKTDEDLNRIRDLVTDTDGEANDLWELFEDKLNNIFTRKIVNRTIPDSSPEEKLEA